jgi:hypothetical protein
MAITISGSGITSANIADGTIVSGDIADGTIVNVDVADLAASKLTGALPAISGAALTNLPGGGKVLQVVTGTYSTETNSTSATYADTGLSATITPSSTSSKILVFGSNNGCGKKSGDTYGDLQLLRGTTSLYVPHTRFAFSNNQEWVYGLSLSFHYLDSPSTTSATTYKTQFKNVSAAGTVRVQDNASVSTITLVEIGA